MLNIRVRTTDGSLPRFGQALERSFRVWLFGTGLGFPVISMVTMLVAKSRLKKHGRTSWDEKTGLVVEHRALGAGRAIVAAGLLLLLFTLAMLDSMAI